VSGPAWYSGDVTRCVVSAASVLSGRNAVNIAAPDRPFGDGGGPSGRGRRTPFGRPVVPDVYIMTAPDRGSCGGSAGIASTSLQSRKPGNEPPTAKRACSGTKRAAAAARSGQRASTTTAPASQFSVTYATSSGVHRHDIGVK